MGLVALDGELLPAADATIAVTDEGLLRGDGVFEVIRLYDGHPFALEEHFSRMRGSAANLRLDFDPEAFRADLGPLLDASGRPDALLRLVATRGGRRIAIVEPLPEHPPGVRLGTVTYAPPRILDGIKSLSYGGNMLATRLAQERGFDEALLVTPHGRVLEGPTSTFFYVRDGTLCTPPLSDHVLDSITRRVLMDEIDVLEEPLALDDLRALEEAFLASTVREVQSVWAVEDVELAVDGPRTRVAAEAFARRVSGWSGTRDRRSGS
jgi:branched-chain amino acid aminotransferase